MLLCTHIQGHYFTNYFITVRTVVFYWCLTNLSKIVQHDNWKPNFSSIFIDPDESDADDEQEISVSPNFQYEEDEESDDGDSDSQSYISETT